MKTKKKKIRPILYSTTLSIALVLGTPEIIYAAAATQNNSASDQQSDDVPSTDINVQGTKKVKTDKPSKESEPSIGQQPNAEGVNNYAVTHSSTGSKTNSESKDVPQSIAVVGQKVLQEQHADTVEKALTNIAGVNTGTGTWNPAANLNPSFFIRGFTANNFYVDGLYDDAAVVSG